MAYLGASFSTIGPGDADEPGLGELFCWFLWSLQVVVLRPPARVGFLSCVPGWAAWPAALRQDRMRNARQIRDHDRALLVLPAQHAPGAKQQFPEILVTQVLGDLDQVSQHG